jgi:metal-responsive CopG/Arc/MetJ family transcriptional regulator
MANAEKLDETMARTQVLLRRDQLRELDAAARRRGVTRSELLREQIDAFLARDKSENDDWRRLQKEAAGVLADDPDFERRMQDIREGWRRREERLWSGD